MMDLDAEKSVIEEIHYKIVPWKSVWRHRGVSLQTYLSYINVLAVYHLNRYENSTVLNLCGEFARLCNEYSPKIEKSEYYEHVDTWSEALFRIGDLVGCQSLISQCLPDINDDKLKCSMLIRLGIAETQSNYPKLVINSLCEALGFAEKLGDSKLMSRCYVEIAKLFGVRYSWLAISLLCDAEVIDERYRDGKSYSEIMMQKAMSFYVIYLNSNYDEKCNVYLEEAKRVLSLVRMEDVAKGAAKALYDMYYGQIYADIERLKESLSFYERAGSVDSVIKLCDKILVAVYRNKNYKEGLEIIPKYLRYVDMLNDSALKKDNIKKILDIEKSIRCITQNSQT